MVKQACGFFLLIVLASVDASAAILADYILAARIFSTVETEYGNVKVQGLDSTFGAQYVFDPDVPLAAGLGISRLYFRRPDFAPYYSSTANLDDISLLGTAWWPTGGKLVPYTRITFPLYSRLVIQFPEGPVPDVDTHVSSQAMAVGFRYASTPVIAMLGEASGARLVVPNFWGKRRVFHSTAFAFGLEVLF